LKSEEVSKELNAEILEKIEALQVKSDDDDNKNPEPQPQPQGGAAPIAGSTSDNNPKPKKSGAALGWIIGGVVLVLTLGAVNTMSNNK
jgi:hypothetical protein